jgi:A/G-specific adenine glycosylase
LMTHHKGEFPNTYQEVIAIPGIGAYTAGAIMAIAFNQPYPATDGNVIRVLSRYYGLEDDMALLKSRNKINQIHQDLVNQTTPRIYIQAVMELGALICRPHQADCKRCPLNRGCHAYKENKVDALPVINKKIKQSIKEWQTFIIVKGNQLLLRKSQENLLKNFYLLPQWDKPIDWIENWFTENHFSPILIKNQKIYKHVFTHLTWFMETHIIKVEKGIDPSGEWFDIHSLDLIPIPEAHQKILREIFPQFRKAKAL